MTGHVVAVLTVVFSLAAKTAIGHQVLLNRRRKSVEGVSVPFFIIGMLSYDLYSLAGILSRNWMITVGMVPGGVLSMAIIVQMMMYRK